MGVYVSYNIWFIMFMSEQGYVIENNVIYQDNQSEMCMEKNICNSSTRNSRHIYIWYFFVKDRIYKWETKVEYCPTNLMLADFFTKLLMGDMFGKLRSVIMGYTSIFELYLMLLQSIKEHVGIWVESDWIQKLFNLVLCVLMFYARTKLLMRVFLFTPQDK